MQTSEIKRKGLVAAVLEHRMPKTPPETRHVLCIPPWRRRIPMVHDIDDPWILVATICKDWTWTIT